MSILKNDELADSLEQIIPQIQRDDWLRYEDFNEQEACTIGHFGCWTVGYATPGFTGGNYRDTHGGDDEAHAALLVLCRNHLPQIIAALRTVEGEGRVDPNDSCPNCGRMRSYACTCEPAPEEGGGRNG